MFVGIILFRIQKIIIGGIYEELLGYRKKSMILVYIFRYHYFLLEPSFVDII